MTDQAAQLTATTGSLSLEDASDVHDSIISEAEAFVKEAFANHDPSHDWHHVHRVRLLALSLSRSPDLPRKPDMLVLELGALFHDLCDAKYSKTANGGAAAALGPFFSRVSIPESQRDEIYRIVDNVSWSKDARRREARERSRRLGEALRPEEEALDAWIADAIEFRCVSDADRLDAIGSIGIMRCAAFSATKNRPLYIPPNNPQMDSVPPAEQSEGYNGSAIAHFHEKLLKIKGDRLFTQAARVEADRRQQMMQSFMTELDIEWMVAQQGAELSQME